MRDVDAFFEGVSQLGGDVSAPAPELAAEAQPAPETPAEAAVETPATPEPAPQEAPQPVEPPKQEQTVPLAVLMRERDERKQIERRNAEMEARLAASAQPQTIPDPVDDPNGFAAALQEQQKVLLTQQRFQMSREIANQQHGAEVVETARKWAMEKANTDPAFDLALGQQPHPIDWIVRQHKRDGVISQIGDEDLDTFVRRRYAELNPIPATPAVASAALGQPAPVPVTPPRSLAAAPSSGGGVKDEPTGPLSALESVFSGR